MLCWNCLNVKGKETKGKAHFLIIRCEKVGFKFGIGTESDYKKGVDMRVKCEYFRVKGAPIG